MNFFFRALAISLVFSLVTFLLVMAGGLILCLIRGVEIGRPLFNAIVAQAFKSGTTCGVPMFVMVCLGYYGRDRRR